MDEEQSYEQRLLALIGSSQCDVRGGNLNWDSLVPIVQYVLLAFPNSCVRFLRHRSHYRGDLGFEPRFRDSMFSQRLLFAWHNVENLAFRPKHCLRFYITVKEAQYSSLTTDNLLLHFFIGSNPACLCLLY